MSVAIAVHNTQPFILVALGAIFFSERIAVTKLMWLGIAFAGALLIVQARPSTAVYAGPDAASISGVLTALSAAFIYTIAESMANPKGPSVVNR